MFSFGTKSKKLVGRCITVKIKQSKLRLLSHVIELELIDESFTLLLTKYRSTSALTLSSIEYLLSPLKHPQARYRVPPVDESE